MDLDALRGLLTPAHECRGGACSGCSRARRAAARVVVAPPNYEYIVADRVVGRLLALEANAVRSPNRRSR
jgi:hypothetical protein